MNDFQPCCSSFIYFFPMLWPVELEKYMVRVMSDCNAIEEVKQGFQLEH